MKLKSRPEDFVVHEISSFVPQPSARLFVYELEKRSLATLEALNIIARNAGMKARDLSAAGLKDKHGLTRQLFSSPRVLPADTRDERLTIRLVGKTASRMTAASIVGNRFEITLRRLREQDLANIYRNAAEIAHTGIPNYYDNQRFGGIAHGQGFAAKALALGNFEEALRLHLAAPHRKQSLTDKTNRRLASEFWGDWDTLGARMKRSPERALVEYLRQHPTDWIGCFERIPAAQRTLFVAAYQSFLFNETLRRMVMQAQPNATQTLNKAGVLAFNRAPLRGWANIQVPLIGPGTRMAAFPEAASAAEDTLREEGLTLAQLALPQLPRTGFKAASRAALVSPTEFSGGTAQPDEINAGMSRITLKFALPRGSFATIVTRRLALD